MADIGHFNRDTRRTRPGGIMILLSLALASAGGCVTPGAGIGSFFGPPEPAPCKLLSYWERSVCIARDCKHEGAPVPGLAGRIFFSGADGKPMAVHGKVAVDWYDMSGPADGPHPRLAGCVYDNAALQLLWKKDIIGWGYTLFAPWPDYRPEITRVRIDVRFIPEKGDPLYGEPASVSLNSDVPFTTQHLTEPITLAPGAQLPTRSPQQ
jgi:hypothetical protein